MKKIHTASSVMPGPALAFQASILEGVSRTFALTIPCLPENLRVPVANAYLLCRIADTIEDDTVLDTDSKRRYGAWFVRVVKGLEPAAGFADDLSPILGPETLKAERELIQRTADVIRVTHSLASSQRRAMTRCVALMSQGMHRFQNSAGPQGLENMRQMDEYCYFVAGVVGEMLTELFSDHARDIAARRARMLELAPSFGQGLQMTNILKDIFEDHKRGICWLPRSEFDLGPESRRFVGKFDLIDSVEKKVFKQGLQRLVVIAHGHLRNALEYTFLIPARHRDIRRFCLWALGMAVPTLRNIHESPGFLGGDEVKISRRQVRWIVRSYGFFAGNDRIVRWIFERASKGLPQSDPGVGDHLLEISQHVDSLYRGDEPEQGARKLATF